MFRLIPLSVRIKKFLQLERHPFVSVLSLVLHPDSRAQQQDSDSRTVPPAGSEGAEQPLMLQLKIDLDVRVSAAFADGLNVCIIPQTGSYRSVWSCLLNEV